MTTDMPPPPAGREWPPREMPQDDGPMPHRPGAAVTPPPPEPTDEPPPLEDPRSAWVTYAIVAAAVCVLTVVAFLVFS